MSLKEMCVLDFGGTNYTGDPLKNKRKNEGFDESHENKRLMIALTASHRRLEQSETRSARDKQEILDLKQRIKTVEEERNNMETEKVKVEQTALAAQTALDGMTGNCSICLDNNMGTRSVSIIILDCGHAFHLTCVEKMVRDATDQVSRVYKSRAGGVITCQLGLICPNCRTEVFPVLSSSDETDEEKTLSTQITRDLIFQHGVLKAAVDTATKRTRPVTRVPPDIKAIIKAIIEPGKTDPNPKLLPKLIIDTHVVACCSSPPCKKAFLLAKQCGDYPETVFCWSCDAAGASAGMPLWTTSTVVHCDRCDQAVDRYTGCSHVTCVCNYEWCQVCGGKFDNWLTVDTGTRSVSTVPFCFTPDDPQQLNLNGKPYRYGVCGCRVRVTLEQERGIVRQLNICLGDTGTMPGWGFEKLARSNL